MEASRQGHERFFRPAAPTLPLADETPDWLDWQEAERECRQARYVGMEAP